MATSMDDFFYRLLNSGRARHPGVGGGMPQTVNPLASAIQNAPAAPSPAPVQPQPAAMGYQMQQSAPQGNSGGFLSGLGNVVQGLLAPQSRGRNVTMDWLQKQGLGAGEATLIAGNPRLLQSFLVERMKGSDPADALKLEKLKLEVDQMRNPTTDDVREYQFARKQGYQGSFTDFMQQMRKSGATNINLPGQPTIGTVPQGWAATQDPATGQWSMAPISGGPAAQEAAAAEQAKATANQSKQRYGNIVLQDIGRMKQVVESSPWYNPAAGFGASWLKENVGGSNAADASALADTIKANIGFDRLQKMREESPTGGALGQVTERELQFLQSVLGSIEQSQSEPQLLANLDRLSEVYRGILEKASAYPNAAKYGFDGRSMSPQERRQERAGNGLGAPSIGTVEDGYRFKGGDPGNPNSWERVQ